MENEDTEKQEDLELPFHLTPYHLEQLLSKNNWFTISNRTIWNGSVPLLDVLSRAKKELETIMREIRELEEYRQEMLER